MTNEEKAVAVMQYIADNEQEIRKAIRKNTTAESEDFLNDIFQEATLKMAQTILKNGTDIKDIKNFVYISMRNLYIIRQTQLRKKRAIMTDQYEHLNDVYDDADNEERYRHINNLICDIKCAVIEEFGHETADMFMEYFSSKTKGQGSYQAISQRFDTTPRIASQTIKRVMEYIMSETELKAKYEEIKSDRYTNY